MWWLACSRRNPHPPAPLEAVKDKIFARLQGEKALAEAMRTAAERRKNLADGPINPTVKTGMGIKTANPMDRSGSLADFGADPELAAALFHAKVGQWLPAAFAVNSPKDGQGAVLVHVGSCAASRSRRVGHDQGHHGQRRGARAPSGHV